MTYIGSQRLDTTAFGELSVSQYTPFVQATGVYGFIPSNFRSYTNASGTTSVGDRMFQCSTGTTIYGYGVIQSLRSLNYNAGQGGMCRFAGLFPSSATGAETGIGLVSLSDEFSFGYDDGEFGIWYRRNGKAEVRTITVNTPSSGSTNLTLTLNSVAYTIPLTAGTTAKNSYEIATWLNANQSVWVADQIDGTVIISAQTDGAKSGTYSYSHATSTGTITQNEAGITKTSTHIPRNSWNVNTCSSWGFNETLGNVYQITYQYLGFGNIRFFVENPNDGKFELVHMIEYPNTESTTSIRNPSLRFGAYAASLGSTTDVSVKCSSVALFVQGLTYKTRNPRATKNTQSVGSTLTNIFAIRNRRTYNYIYNQVEIEPVNLTVASESSKNVEVEIRTNPTFSGVTNFLNVGTNLVSDVDTTANTVSGGTLLASFTVAPGDTLVVDLDKFAIRIPPSITVSIAAKVTSGAASNVSASLTYYEDL